MVGNHPCPHEMQALLRPGACSFSGGNPRFSQNPSRDASRALAKETRNSEIKELSKIGLSQKEICEALKVSL